MEVLFILVLLVVVVGVLGGGVLLIAARLRKQKLSPEGDLVEGEAGEQRRPLHRRVTSEQQTEFVHDR